MTVTEAAALLGVSAGRVRQLIGAGRLPAERVHPQLMLLPRSAVEAFAGQPRRGGWPKGKARKTDAHGSAPPDTTDSISRPSEEQAS